MFSHPVGFITPQTIEKVTPPFIKGKPDSTWVTTRTDNEKDIKDAAIRKLKMCYGITVEPSELTIYAGFES